MVTVVRWNPQAVIDAFHDAGNAEIDDALKAVLETSQSSENVPVLDDVLRPSGYVNGPLEVGPIAKFAIGYDTHYALLQHENLDFNHPRGGRAKFLEIPLGEALPSMPERVAAGITRRLGG